MIRIYDINFQNIWILLQTLKSPISLFKLNFRSLIETSRDFIDWWNWTRCRINNQGIDAG